MKLSFNSSDSEKKTGKLTILKIRIWTVGHPGELFFELTNVHG